MLLDWDLDYVRTGDRVLCDADDCYHDNGVFLGFAATLRTWEGDYLGEEHGWLGVDSFAPALEVA